MKAVNENMAKKLGHIADALNFRESEKIPTGIQNITWALDYAGLKQPDVWDDPVKWAAAYTQVFRDIEFDISTFGMNTIPIKPIQPLGVTKYYLGNDGVSVLHKQVDDVYFGPEFYDDVIEGGIPALMEYNNRVYRSCIPVLKYSRDEAVAKFKEVVPFFKSAGMFFIAGEQMLQEIGIPEIINMSTPDMPAWFNPISSILDTYRGIKDTTLDLRRRPEKVKAVCDIIMEQKYLANGYERDPEVIRKKIEGDPVAFGGNILNAECFLSRKDFEKFYIDYFKKQLGPYIEAGVKVYIYMEGEFSRVVDLYKELPKGSLFLQPDMDDPFDIYDKIGDYHSICSGARVSLLKSGTKEENIDYAKKCIDKFAPGGGFIFEHNQSLISAGDVNKENFKAVYDYVNSIGR